MYHALALIGVSLVSASAPQRLTAAAGWCFVWGTVLFSGSLYLLALTGSTWLGIVTPFGGVLFLAGWACLAGAAVQSQPNL
jgi:uncharacterized membrane protein YgdD (TMEM256/DUF423 family)